MRRVLFVMGLLLLTLLLLPHAAGLVTPVSAAAVDPTRIEAAVPSSLVAGTQTALTATLRDTATNDTVGGALLTFSEKTTFGTLLLGNRTTDASGRASVPYEPVYNGTFTIVVSYGGNASYAPSNATLALNVLAAAAPPVPPFPSETVIVFVIIAVVGSVWLTYAFVGMQILGIRSIGSRDEDEEFESKERKKMERPTEGDAVAPPKRAPAFGNANRAVVYLAISAIVLSGAAVALIAMGGVGHSAAYTPTTVNLQVTVVPDFRGAAYDSFVPDELVVHQGDTVKITVYNEDTMDHGFAIDALSVNQVIPAATQDNVTGDITPSVTLISFTVPSSGAFTWYCTNPCGPGHTTMIGTLLVLPDD